MNITFTAMQSTDIPLWQQWIQKPHVRDVWFIEGYEPADYIDAKITGNGYDHPYIIRMEEIPIGYIVCCDLYAYRTVCSEPKGLFTKEDKGTFCMDIFIAEEAYLNRGYGTAIVRQFAQFIFDHFHANIIYIDPAKDNLRAIRCYEKAGFQFVREAFDGITMCCVMKMKK